MCLSVFSSVINPQVTSFAGTSSALRPNFNISRYESEYKIPDLGFPTYCGPRSQTVKIICSFESSTGHHSSSTFLRLPISLEAPLLDQILLMETHRLLGSIDREGERLTPTLIPHILQLPGGSVSRMRGRC